MRDFSNRVRIVALVVCVALGMSGALWGQDEPAQEQPDQPSTVNWQVESSHPILAPADTSFYLRIRITAPKVEIERQPLHLALVFDRSGSMQEEAKIGYVRKAAHLVVDNLTKRDHVAFIAYNHQVQVLVLTHPVVNREYLHHRIDELYADGYTNLSGGLLEGCAQLDKRLGEPGIHHVILLTDGLANRGITDPNVLVRVVDQCARRGISVSTIGVGTEYNESLLGRIAQAGGGRYVYVAKPDQIPSAFEQELGAMLSVVAQNARLKIEMPLGVEPLQVYSREEPLQPDKLELDLGDLTSGDERTLLVRFRVSTAPQSDGSIELPLELTYDDIAQASRVQLAQSISMDKAAPGTTTAGKLSPVLAYVRLVEAVDKIALAVQGMDRRLAAEVRQIQQREYPALRDIARASGDQDFVNKAFMFEHYARELQDLIDYGALHEHSLERAQLQKELHYRRYLMEHHQYDHRH
jgi:Ca-activated chloride channel family protein